MFRTVRGTRDVLPDEMRKRVRIFNIAREIFHLFGYEEIQTPTIEYFDLLALKIGDEIRHRMYVFQDLKGRKLALRPEMTTSVARLVSTKMRNLPKPIRLSYIANCFRYDNPQAARYREFWQVGFELIGSDKPCADAEILAISEKLIDKIGLSEKTMKIGHVGILRSLLENEGINEHEQNLILGLIDKGKHEDALCKLKELRVSDTCINKISRLFALRSDSLEKVYNEARKILIDYPEASEHLENLREIIELFNFYSPKAKLSIELGFARGLEYYTGMIFEIYVPSLNVAIGGGGRYDNLLGIVSSENLPAVGSSIGVDRALIALATKHTPDANRRRIFITATSRELYGKAIQVASLLREDGIQAELDVQLKGLRGSLSYANRKGFLYAIILAPKEIESNSVIIKNLENGMQQIVKLEALPSFFRESVFPSEPQ